MMTTTQTTTKRISKALEVLAAGGFFVKQLERHYLGGEKFRTRLYDAGRNVVAGVGSAALIQLQAEGKVQRRWDVHYGSVCREEWIAV